MAISIDGLINEIHNNAETSFDECMTLVQQSRALNRLDAKIMLVRATSLAETVEVGQPRVDDRSHSPRLQVFEEIISAYKDIGMEMNEGLAVAQRALELVPFVL